MKNLAIIRFWYEGNAFSPIEATRGSFEAREWFSGQAANDFYRNTNLELAAVDGFIEDNPDIEPHYVFCAAAYPAGPMQAGLFLDMLGRVESGLRGRSWHGVYLSLHGSAVTPDDTRAETRLLERVREVVGAHVPVAATFDLHANLNPDIGQLANIVCGYKTYPHVDMLETAAKALNLLGRAMALEIKPVTTIVPADFAPTSFNMRTEQGPMADVVARAGEIELEHGCFDVSAYGGFIYGDTVDTGASVSICAIADASAEATRLARYFRARAPRFDVRLPAVSEALIEIDRALAKGDLKPPVAILEPSDNIFSGGAADTPGLLSAVLQAEFPRRSVFAFFCDPQLVRQAQHAGVGGSLTGKIGGRLTTAFGPPVEISARVTKLTAGRFKNRGPMEKNLEVDLGPTAVIAVNTLSIIVTSNNIPVNDIAYFELHELLLDDFDVIYVKAKNHFRSAFSQFFSRIVEVETPGPAASNLESFHFNNLPDYRLHSKISIRDATVDDARAIADIHTMSWRDVYRNILPENYLSDEIEDERKAFWNQKLLHKDRSEIILTIGTGELVVGFIWICRHGEPGYDAVIEALHIDASAKRCGYGKQLMKAAVQRAIDQGARSICLRVFDDNKAAIQFYEHIGGVKDQSGIDGFAGANAPDSRIGWRDSTTLLDKLAQGNRA